MDLKLKRYKEQVTEDWPEKGEHILAQFDDDSIVVYQAFSPTIADYAVSHQCFGGKGYSTTRMTWIKTNFLWMMFRSGWAEKKDQERILAIRLKLNFFIETLLANSISGRKTPPEPVVRGQSAKSLSEGSKLIRRQWDPDHMPCGSPYKDRRAIQLGIKGYFQEFNENIINIQDITDYVKHSKKFINKSSVYDDNFLIPEEKVLFDQIPDSIRNVIFS